MLICGICNEQFNTKRGLNVHIRKHNILNSDYYIKFLKSKYEEYCNNVFCINDIENRPNYNKCIGLQGFKKFCSLECQYKYLSTNKDINKKRKTNMKKAWMNTNSGLNSMDRIEKIRKSHLGAKRSEEAKLNMSISHLGHMPWNKGKKTYYRRRTITKIIENYLIFAKEEEMRYNPYKFEEKEIQVHCKHSECENSKENGGWFTPNTRQIELRIYEIEKGNGGGYFYCCQACKNECILYNLKSDPYKESIEKPYTQKEINIWKQVILEQDNYECQYCQSKKELHGHHIHPVKTHPHLALDPTNGIVLCKSCHYKIGHKYECNTGNLANKQQNGCKLGSKEKF